MVNRLDTTGVTIRLVAILSCAAACFGHWVGQTVPFSLRCVQPLVAPTVHSGHCSGFPHCFQQQQNFIFIFLSLCQLQLIAPFLYIWRTAGSKEQWGQDEYAGLQCRLDLPKKYLQNLSLLRFLSRPQTPGSPCRVLQYGGGSGSSSSSGS